MSSRKNLISFLRILIKWRLMILIVVLIAAIGSVIIALVLPNYYQSTATFLPSNLSALDRQVLFSTESGDRMINYFGDANDIDRILAFANSGPLINDVIMHYKLYDHYNIDTTSTRWMLKTRNEFEDNYKALKSERGYVEISILDQDKELAAQMVNYIVQKIDNANTELVLGRNRQILSVVEKQLEEKEAELESLSDSLTAISDTTRITYKVLFRKQNKVIEDFNNLNTLVSQYKSTVNNEFSSLYIIEGAQPADKKTKPVRWLIVVSSVLIALFLSIVAAVVIEQYKDIKYELNNA